MKLMVFHNSQVINSDVNYCEFRNCHTVMIVGSANNCRFLNCSLVGMGGSSNNSIFINCPKISIKKSCNNSTFRNCLYNIHIGGMINDCIKNGELYDDGYSRVPKYIPDDCSAPDNI
jgi:hypothetical protein